MLFWSKLKRVGWEAVNQFTPEQHAWDPAIGVPYDHEIALMAPSDRKWYFILTCASWLTAFIVGGLAILLLCLAVT